MEFENLQELFYNELYKNISGDDKGCENIVVNTNVEKCKEEEEEVCLISNEPLTENFITLQCGHKFNYDPLFNEVYQQKWKVQPNEVVKLQRYQIKCPYCRNIQTGILPKIDGYLLLRYVNSPKKYVMKFNKCKYVRKSGKNKGSVCDTSCTFDYCDRCSSLVKKAREREKLKNTKKCDTVENNKQCSEKNTCCAILQSGENKGSVCGKPAKYENIEGDNITRYYCGRHKSFQKTK